MGSLPFILDVGVDVILSHRRRIQGIRLRFLTSLGMTPMYLLGAFNLASAVSPIPW